MEKVQMTVGFVDMAKFMVTFKEADAMVEGLQTFYQAVGDRIFAHGGRIIKYIGDCILFTFPEPGPAVAALQEITALTIKGCHINGSLATGEVYHGPCGHPDFQLDDVLGPVVNTAALLMKQARNAPDHMALCETTLSKS